MDKRKSPRIAVRSLSVDINDGVGFFQGLVANVSWKGICMTDLSKRVNSDAQRLTVVISGNNENFRMLVRPKWCLYGSVGKTVGAEIVNVPVGWKEMIMNLEPPMLDGEDVAEIIM